MEVNNENYFSKEVRSRFMTVSTFKSIVGTEANPSCEAKAIAKKNGWVSEFEKSETALLVGSYVDRYFEGTLDKFKEENPDIFLKDGFTLKSEYRHANIIIKYIERDSLFMNALNGEKQKILKGKLWGMDWIGKADVVHKNSIVDLKIMKDFLPIWVNNVGKVNFVKAHGYDLQLAIYQELEFQMTGIKKPVLLAVATKQKPPRKKIIEIPQEILDEALMFAKIYSESVNELYFEGKEPVRCENCDYCVETQDCNRIYSYYEL